MKLRLFVIILLLTASCKEKNNDWQTLDFKVFKIKTPQGWKVLEEQGIDSYGGGLTDGKDTLWVDYGMYGSSIGDGETTVDKVARDTINGIYVLVALHESSSGGSVSLHIPKVSEKVQFTARSNKFIDTGTIFKMFKTLIFKNSDTTINPPLTAGKFALVPHGGGKLIFQMNCIACHAMHKELTGPALGSIVDKRSADWIYKFLTASNLAARESMQTEISKAYEIRCVRFPSLTRLDVDLLIGYVKTFGAPNKAL